MSAATVGAVPVTITPTRRVLDVNATVRDHAALMGSAITRDRLSSLSHRKVRAALIRNMFALERSRFGLGAGSYPLTSTYDPAKGKDSSTNAKIGKNSLATVSLTLQSATVAVIPSAGSDYVLNTCTSSGLCESLCVLKHGKGSLPAVIRARNWRTWILVKFPELYAVLLAYELDVASALHGEFLARLNVNSDILWHLVPELFASSGMRAYDYTKHVEVLDTLDGWVLPNYRLIYSLSERSDDGRASEFLSRGGAVAMVTNRTKGHAAQSWVTVGGHAWRVEDGDISDDRYATPPSRVVDLYAKGKARNRPTRFVRKVYG